MRGDTAAVSLVRHRFPQRISVPLIQDLYLAIAPVWRLPILRLVIRVQPRPTLIKETMDSTLNKV